MTQPKANCRQPLRSGISFPKHIQHSPGIKGPGSYNAKSKYERWLKRRRVQEYSFCGRLLRSKCVKLGKYHWSILSRSPGMGRTFGANKAAAKEENLVGVSSSFPVLSCRSMSRLANQAGHCTWSLNSRWVKLTG